MYQRTFSENLKGIGPLGRELCKIFQGQVRHKIIKTLKETSTWTRHACVQQQKFCPSVADSLNGWQPVQTGFWWRVCSPQHHARGSFWSDQADLHQPNEKGSAPAMPERGDAKPEWGFQCHHDLEYVAQTGICWCWSGGAISTSGCSPL